jgi:type IV pilus assembly protein PilW
MTMRPIAAAVPSASRGVTISRLQESARYVFDVIEPDIRMAQFWGLGTHAYAIENRAGPDEPASTLSPSGDCGNNWAIDLDAAVSGSNGGYNFACSAYGNAVAGADTLVIRRAAAATVATPAANTLYVQTTRADNSSLFEGPDLPPGLAQPDAEIRALVVNGYYVSENSSLDSPERLVPSLRRKFLRSTTSGPAIADEEILPGVEDLQIQFGIDTDLEGSAERGTVDRYVNPDDPVLDATAVGYDPNAQIMAVRIWLRLRAERPQIGIAEGPALAYADQDLPPFTDDFRRLVVSRTIFLRNAH